VDGHVSARLNVLALNSGSSSLKMALFSVDGGAEKCLARGALERTGRDGGKLTLKNGEGSILVEQDAPRANQVESARALFDALARTSLPVADAIGHRLVHGGFAHSAPARVDASLRASLGELVRFAPLHLPPELAVLDAAVTRFPDLPQVVCFDTAFHRGLPEAAERLALPSELYDEGVRRYGFHGLSYEYVVETIGAAHLGRAVIAHLGSGASMAAIREGRSVDTTMGLTPAGGLVMGTRTGDLDPGVLVYLMDHHGYGARDLEELVNRRSGLLGVSGTTGDMKTLLEARGSDARAALAVEMFCYAARKSVGAFAAALGGLETIVFTGGIGERAAAVRDVICAGLAYLGVKIDPARNERGDACVSDDVSACRVLVVHTDEERMIARHVSRALS
jgi:acetate kinase